MPTIKDIAREAGVSHGTVSNVLNKTGKVSAEKIRLVEEAAKKLGYKPNMQAQQLRQGSSRSVCLLLPSFSNSCYQDFYDSFYQQLTKDGYDIVFYLTEGIPEIESSLWQKACALRPDAIVCISAQESIPDLSAAECPVIFLNQPAPRSRQAGFASFDFSQAGKDIANYMNRTAVKYAALFTSVSRHYSNICFAKSLAESLAPNIQLIQFTSDDKLILGKAFDILQSPRPFDLVVTDTPERAESLLRAARCRCLDTPPQILALTSLRTAPDGRFLCYEMNYRYMGQAVARAILEQQGKKDSPAPTLTLPNSGFRFQFPGLNRREGETLQILTLESPAATALNRILPDFEKRTGIRPRLTILPFDELYDTISTAGGSGFYDLIRMDTAWMSHLAERVYQPLDCAGLPQLKGRLIPEIDESYFQAAGTVYTLPFDPSIQMLYYRKDLFEDAMIRRQYYERYRRELEVPKTFQDYNQTAAFFTRSRNPSSPTEFGTTLTFGTAGVAACDYLPRFLEKTGSLFDEQGLLSINTPQAREALENYLEAFQYTNRATNKWWAQSIESFSQGNTAMTITFSNHASLLINSKHSSVVGKVGCAMVPGGHPLTGGGVIGISRGSKHPEAAMEFLKWVYSDETAQLLTLLGGFLPSRSIYDNAEITALFPWMEALPSSFVQGTPRTGSPMYRNFNEKKFENLLGIAVRNAVTGMASPQEALEYAQTMCQASLSPDGNGVN